MFKRIVEAVDVIFSFSNFLSTFEFCSQNAGGYEFLVDIYILVKL